MIGRQAAATLAPEADALWDAFLVYAPDDRWVRLNKKAEVIRDRRISREKDASQTYGNSRTILWHFANRIELMFVPRKPCPMWPEILH
jgi:hypothetical protein